MHFRNCEHMKHTSAIDVVCFFLQRIFCLCALLGFAMTMGSSVLCAQKSWSVTYKGIGTFSSPRITDVTGDGIGDVIFGAGREEFQACDSAVLAVDGQTGNMLWRVSAK